MSHKQGKGEQNYMINKFFVSNMEFFYSPFLVYVTIYFLYCEFYKILTFFTTFVAFLIIKGHAKELNVLIIGNFYTPLTRFFGPEKNRVKGKPC